jgi:molybdenum cofactor synthesis domain-containing protein
MTGKKQMRAVVITVSDTRQAGDDMSGKLLSDLLRSAGAEIVERVIVSDDLEHLRNTLYSFAERDDVDLIMTTGGTGFGPRDNTPEATRGVIEREAPGVAEAIRRETAFRTPMAMLSRGICGICGKTLIINLPGSPRGVEECFEVVRPVLGHAVKLVLGDTTHDS